jgi:hypothetical protein
MAAYRAEKLEGRGRLEEIVVLTGHAPRAPATCNPQDFRPFEGLSLTDPTAQPPRESK